MRCSEDLRRRVMKAVHDGATNTEAAVRFKVSLSSVTRWKKKLVADKPGPRGAHKVDMAALEQHVAQHSDAYLSERAAHFGVTPQAIWYALKRLKLSKKNVAVHGKM